MPLKSLLFCCSLLLSFPLLAANTAFEKLLADIWQYELSVNPILASSHGRSDLNASLPDISPQGLARTNQGYQSWMDKLNAIEPDSLNRSEQITLQIQKRRLQNHLDQYRFNAHYMPITSEYGFHNAMGNLPNAVHFQREQDYQDYLSRLTQLPAYFDQQIAWMKQGMATGTVQPKAVLKGYEESVSAYLVDKVEDSSFYQPFNKLADNSTLSKRQKKQLQAKAKTLISQQVLPAYQRFYDFLAEEYIPKAKNNIAASSWPNGRAYYENRSRHYTSTDLSAEAIHKIGLAEVKRIRAEMQNIVDEVGFDGSVNDFIQFLRSDPQFYAKSPEELIQYASYLGKQADAQLPRFFYRLPRTPYGVAPVPESIAPKYTTGRYLSPGRDDQPGYYWVNTYALDKRPLYALPALTLHEAVPGHHLQISLAREMDALPPVRRYTYISAFGEGWGLYSEYLGQEMGIYQTPYDHFGRLSYEMWRACRLVVDTGMHLKGWSRQQAIDYMLENTALSEHNVKTEIDRYISWPAQALSYKIGELTIKRLRKQAEKALKDQFDLRAFHDAVLAHGSVPLSVLEENIQHFINSQQKR